MILAVKQLLTFTTAIYRHATSSVRMEITILGNHGVLLLRVVQRQASPAAFAACCASCTLERGTSGRDTAQLDLV